MSPPGLRTLLHALRETWPPASRAQVGAVVVRQGQGGGRRASAATLDGALSPDDLVHAEAAMRQAGDRPLFQVPGDDAALDCSLAAAGYASAHPSRLYLVEAAALAGPLPAASAYTVWEPLAIMRDIWAAGGIGPARQAVMARAPGPKTGLVARADDHAAGAGFVAMHRGIAMVHALEVLPARRRHGAGRLMMRAAARWAVRHRAAHLALAVSEGNAAACALYASLGMEEAGGYHYRIKETDDGP